MIKRYSVHNKASLRERMYHYFVGGFVHHVMMGCILTYITLMSLNGDMIGLPFYETFRPIINQIFFAIMCGEFLVKLILSPKHVLSKPWSYMEAGLLVFAYTVPGYW